MFNNIQMQIHIFIHSYIYFPLANSLFQLFCKTVQHLFNMSVYLYIFLSIYIYVSTCLSISIYLPVYLYLCIYLSIYIYVSTFAVFQLNTHIGCIVNGCFPPRCFSFAHLGWFLCHLTFFCGLRAQFLPHVINIVAGGNLGRLPDEALL